MADIRVRFKDNPNVWVWLTMAEYHRRIDEIVKPYDPDRPVRPWPYLEGMFVEDPSRLGRLRLNPSGQEE